MALAKVLPLIAATGLGGTLILNKKWSDSSEEVEMSVMGHSLYKDVEKDWGQEDNKEIKVSFWGKEKEEEGFKRSREGRKETHQDIFIFDLCNQWIEFAGSGGDRNENQQQDKSEGYRYTWQDVCSIVKSKGNEVDWLEFVTNLMGRTGVIQIKEDCCGQEKICPNNKNWNKGEWLKKCFEQEKVVHGGDPQSKKICESIWNSNGNKNTLVSIPEIQNNCFDRKLIEKISKKIKISRSGFGDSGNVARSDNNSNYWCSDNQKNGYKDKNGNGSIKTECQTLLKQKIKEFVNKQNSSSGREEQQAAQNNDKCKGIYNGSKVEVKCSSGWTFRSQKSSKE